MAKASDYLVSFEGGHGAFTAGKSSPFIKSLGRQIREHEFNQPVANLFEAELKRCGFRTLQIAPGDADIGLTERADAANKAKSHLHASIHYNALDGKFDGDAKDPSGFSAHIHPGAKAKEAGRFAAIALKHLAKGTKQKNRGVVEQNLAITRQTNMPAVLFELGFMDNEREALLMLNKAFQKECAQELAQAVCEFFKVPYVAEKEVGKMDNTGIPADIVYKRDYLMKQRITDGNLPHNVATSMYLWSALYPMMLRVVAAEGVNTRDAARIDALEAEIKAMKSK